MNSTFWTSICLLGLTVGCDGKLECGAGTKEVGGECVGTSGDDPESETEKDEDGDGYISVNDCDDTEASAHPGAEEFCDEIDNDCAGQIDEGPPTRELP